MAVPTLYDQTTLVDYLHLTLGETADVLGWNAADDRFVEIVNDALVRYGVSDLDEATNIPKLRALARVALWSAVTAATVGYYSFSIDQQSTSLKHIPENARAMLEAAERDAAQFDVPVVQLSPVRHLHDPYRYFPLEDRGLR